MAERMAPSEMILSREKLHGNYGTLVGESTGHLEVLKSIDTFAKSSEIVLISGKVSKQSMAQFVVTG